MAGQCVLLCDPPSLLAQAIRVFFMLRSLSLQLRGEPETQLPLTRPEDLIKMDDVLDLSESHMQTHHSLTSCHFFKSPPGVIFKFSDSSFLDTAGSCSCGGLRGAPFLSAPGALL